MQHEYFKGFEVSDFPMAGGIFRPKLKPALVEIDSISTAGMGERVEFLSKTVRLGKQRLPKGSMVKSRLRYMAENLSSGVSGPVDLVTFDDQKGHEFNLVISQMPLHQGDKLEISFVNFSRAGKAH